MIGDAFKITRNMLGYTSKEISEKLQISPSHLSEIEHNKKEPTLLLIQEYANLLTISPSTLLQLSEHIHDKKKKDQLHSFMLEKLPAIITILLQK